MRGARMRAYKTAYALSLLRSSYMRPSVPSVPRVEAKTLLTCRFSHGTETGPNLCRVPTVPAPQVVSLRWG
jgi:hypothetical protein